MFEKEIKILDKNATDLSNNFEVKLKFINNEKENFSLDSINVYLAFCPSVWKCLSIVEKLAVIKIAKRRLSVAVDYDYCYLPTASDIFIVEKNHIIFNIASLEEEFIDPIIFLTEIINLPNLKKFVKYTYQPVSNISILNFKTFEQLQYSTNISPVENIDDGNVNDLTRAIFFDQIYTRKHRQSRIIAIGEVLNYINQLNLSETENYYRNLLIELEDMDNFIEKTLGKNLIIRDYAYLRVVHNLFEINKISDEKITILDAVKHFKSHFGKNFIRELESKNIVE